MITNIEEDTPVNNDQDARTEPVTPVEPTVSQPTVTQPVVPPTGPKKSNKGLIGLLVGLGVLGLLAIIALVSYFAFFYISPADYRQAGEQTNTVIDNYNKASDASTAYMDAVESPLSTDAMIKEKETAYHTAYNAYLESVKKLSSERAMRNDKVKAAYDAFAAKNKSFTDNNATIEQAIPTLRQIAVNCDEQKIGEMDTNDLGQLVAQYDKAVGPCVTSMKSLASATNVDAAKIGKKASTYFDEMRVHIVNMEAAYKANDRTKFENEYNAFLAKADAFDQDTDVASIQKHQDSLEPSDELNNLATVISKQ